MGELVVRSEVQSTSAISPRQPRRDLQLDHNNCPHPHSCISIGCVQIRAQALLTGDSRRIGFSYAPPGISHETTIHETLRFPRLFTHKTSRKLPSTKLDYSCRSESITFCSPPAHRPSA